MKTNNFYAEAKYIAAREKRDALRDAIKSAGLGAAAAVRILMAAEVYARALVDKWNVDRENAAKSAQTTASL